MSAGARFTVILAPPGNVYPEFFIALRTRSLDSCMAVSQSHTTVNCPIPVTTSTSTSIICPDIPDIDAEKNFCIEGNVLVMKKFYGKKREMEIFFMKK